MRSSVDRLLFPVKRLGVLLLLAGCGYRPVYAAGAGEQLCVRAGAAHTAEFAAMHSVIRGAMRELQRAGALAQGSQEPCMVIELLRVEEVATGIQVEPTRSGEQPRAQGSEVWVTGRAWVERAGAVSRDTGDVRRSARGASALTSVSDTQRYRALVVAAAEELGAALSERILGLPSVDLAY